MSRSVTLVTLVTVYRPITRKVFHEDRARNENFISRRAKKSHQSHQSH